MSTVGPPYLWVLHLQISPTCRSRMFREKYYIVTARYYVIRPKMVESVLNMYRHFL